MGYLGFKIGRIETCFGARGAIVRTNPRSIWNKTPSALLGIDRKMAQRRELRLESLEESSTSWRTLNENKLGSRDLFLLTDHAMGLMEQNKRREADDLMRWMLSDLGRTLCSGKAEHPEWVTVKQYYDWDGLLKDDKGIDGLTDTIATAAYSSFSREKMTAPKGVAASLDYLYYARVQMLYRLNRYCLEDNDCTTKDKYNDYYSKYMKYYSSGSRPALASSWRIQKKQLVYAFAGITPLQMSYKALVTTIKEVKISARKGIGEAILAATIYAFLLPLMPVISYFLAFPSYFSATRAYKMASKVDKFCFSHTQEYFRVKGLSLGLPADLMENSDPGGLAKLQEALMFHKFGFPSPVPAEPAAIGFNRDLPNIVIVGDTCEDHMALIRAAEKETYANVMLIASPQWLSYSRLSKFPLSIKKALLYSNGELRVVNYDKPIPVHYLANFPGWKMPRSVERLPAPTHKGVGYVTGNKQLTFQIFEKAGYEFSPYTKAINNMDEIGRIISEAFQCGEEVAIKPAKGERGEGVVFFTRDQRDKAEKHAREQLAQKGEPIVQERIVPPLLNIDGQAHDWNFRVFVSRGEDGKPRVTEDDLAVRYDHKNGPVNISISAKVMSFDELADRLGLSPAQKGEMFDRVKVAARSAFSICEEAAKQGDYGKKLRAGHEPDFMGVDIIVSEKNGSLKPYVIEVNDAHSGGMWDLDNVVSKDKVGGSSRGLIRAMTAKAARYKSEQS